MRTHGEGRKAGNDITFPMEIGGFKKNSLITWVLVTSLVGEILVPTLTPLEMWKLNES